MSLLEAKASQEAPLEVGVVLKPHGLRGEVKVKLHFAESDALVHARAVLLKRPDGTEEERAVISARNTGKGWLVGFEGITDCDAAEALRGTRLLVPRSELPPLEPGEYYLVDLIGCSVFVVDDAGERLVGQVREVRPDPSVDTLVIEAPDGSRVEQPLADAWLGKVDVAQGRIELVNEDGLIR